MNNLVPNTVKHTDKFGSVKINIGINRIRRNDGCGKGMAYQVNISSKNKGLVVIARICGKGKQIINIGSGRDTSVRELVHLVLQVTGGTPEIVYNPRNERGPARMCADLSLAQEKLGYKPQVSLRQGLIFTLEGDGRLRQK